jgi:hypothetical protein
MSTITTPTIKPPAQRHQPKRPKPGEAVPNPAVKGKVTLNLLATPNPPNKSLTLSMSPGTPGLSGHTATHGYYLRVEPGKTVQIDLELSTDWDWRFVTGTDDVTIGDAGHAVRYWVLPNPVSDRVRTLIIEPSGHPAVSAANDKGQNDEKFNLMVEIAQSGTAVPLVIEFDPITKNPPPVDGLMVPAGQAVPIL